jgi:DNA-binding protein YbaB
MSDPDAADLLKVVAAAEHAMSSTREELRERIYESESVDGLVQLRVNGESLALGVKISPELIRQGQAAIELGVMQAINDAAIMIQEATTAAFQQAVAVLFGIPPAEDADVLPPSLRSASSE